MFEFITIGGGEYYVDIFNGIAAIIRSGDFLSVVKIASAIAFSMAILNAALNNSLYDTGRWFLTIFVITQALLYPKASVHITDKTNNALMGAQVDNVPFVVAYAASTSSQVGYSLTKLFETVFSLPDDLQYSENGMIFGVNLLQAMSQARITNSNLTSSIDSFTKNCIFFDLQFNIYSFEDFKNADDIWNFVKSTQTENRFFTYVARDGNVSYPSCKSGAVSLEADWNQELNSPTNIGFFAKKPDLTNVLLATAAPDVNQYFLNVSKSSQKILQQAMMVNAVNDAIENSEAESEVQLYQNTRAMLQTKSTYQTIGAQAGIWVPILKIVIELIFIAAFPMVVLLSFIPNMTGSVLRGYLGTFFWLASWGPIYAVLHRISMGHAHTYTVSFHGLTLYNQFGIEQAMNNIAAMAGYMSMFVPMLALGIAKGGAAAMSSMTTSFLSAASSAVHEGATGNLNFGNVGIGSRQISSGYSIMNDAGQVLRHHDDGSSAIDNSFAESRLGIDVRGSERIESAFSSQISQEQSLAQTKSVQAAQTRAHGFEMAMNNHHAIESSNGYEKNFSSEEKSAFNRINNAATDFAREHGITREKSAEILAGVGLGANVDSGKGFGGGSIGGSASLIGNAQMIGRSSDQDHYKAAANYSTQHSLSKDFAVVQSALQSNRFNLTDSKGESINETFNRATSLNKEAGQHFENAKRFSEQQQYIKSHSAEYGRDYSQELWRELVDRYGENSATQILNPNNSDKNTLNQEVRGFVSSRSGDITHVQKPDLSSEYSAGEDKYSIHKSSNPYHFSSHMKGVNNSDLQNITPKQFSDTKQKIENAEKNNADFGGKIIDKVKKEEEDGLL